MMIAAVDSSAFMIGAATPRDFTLLLENRIAWPCAILSLIFVLLARIISSASSSRESGKPETSTRFLHTAGLLLGAVAAIVIVLLLTVRAVFATVDLTRGFDATANEMPPFTISGVWVIGILSLACLVAWHSSGQRALTTCFYWLCVMLALWVCLLMPVYETSRTGRPERTALTLWMMASLSVITLIAVALVKWWQARSRWLATFCRPDELATPANVTRGFRISCGAVAMFVLMLVSFHLAVPTAMIGVEAGRVLMITTLSAGACSLACFLLVERSWSAGVADVGIALASLMLCSFCLERVPARSVALIDFYPIVFTCMIIALSMSAWLCAWLSIYWRQQLLENAPWTTAGRLIPHARSFAFVNSSLGLVIAALLAAWPRLPWIATSDETLGRLLAGVGANLFLLVVILWCARKLRRFTFLIMALVAMASVISFIVLRTLPFTTWSG